MSMYGKHSAVTWLIAGVLLVAGEEAARATCSTDPAKHAFGAWWIERNGANACLFKAQSYPCGATGGYRDPAAAVTLYTLDGTAGTSCEDSPGYATALASVRGRYAPSTGNYECDTVFSDQDADGFGACIDQNDGDPRIWVKSNGAETACDGVDNDGDGVIDDGFASACPPDYKRLDDGANYQGDGESRVHLIAGSVHRVEADIAVEGPFGPLSFVRTYNSGRTSDDASLGRGWVHNHAVNVRQQPAGDDRWVVQTPSGESQYFRCTALAAEMSCAIDDHVLRGNLRRTAGFFYWYPGDGTYWKFDDTVKNGRRAYSYHVDSAGDVLSAATTDASGRVTSIASANPSIYLSLSHGTYGLDAVRASSSTGNQVLDVDVISASGASVLDRVKFANTLGTIDANTYVAYSYNASTLRLESVKKNLDGSTELTTAAYGYDANGRATSVKDASKTSRSTGRSTRSSRG